MDKRTTRAAWIMFQSAILDKKEKIMENWDSNDGRISFTIPKELRNAIVDEKDLLLSIKRYICPAFPDKVSKTILKDDNIEFKFFHFWLDDFANLKEGYVEYGLDEDDYLCEEDNGKEIYNFGGKQNSKIDRDCLMEEYMDLDEEFLDFIDEVIKLLVINLNINQLSSPFNTKEILGTIYDKVYGAVEMEMSYFPNEDNQMFMDYLKQRLNSEIALFNKVGSMLV